MSKYLRIGNGDYNIVTKEGGEITLDTTDGLLNGSGNVIVTGDLEVKGDIRFNAKKFSVGDKPPTEGNFNKGDIVYNTDPAQGRFVGWVCIDSGNPGIWKGFGVIEK